MRVPKQVGAIPLCAIQWKRCEGFNVALFLLSMFKFAAGAAGSERANSLPCTVLTCCSRRVMDGTHHVPHRAIFRFTHST